MAPDGGVLARRPADRSGVGAELLNDPRRRLSDLPDTGRRPGRRDPGITAGLRAGAHHVGALPGVRVDRGVADCSRQANHRRTGAAARRLMARRARMARARRNETSRAPPASRRWPDAGGCTDADRGGACEQIKRPAARDPRPPRFLDCREKDRRGDLHCETRKLADRVRREAAEVGLEAQRKTLRVELLETISKAAIAARTTAPAIPPDQSQTGERMVG